MYYWNDRKYMFFSSDSDRLSTIIIPLICSTVLSMDWVIFVGWYFYLNDKSISFMIRWLRCGRATRNGLITFVLFFITLSVCCIGRDKRMSMFHSLCICVFYVSGFHLCKLSGNLERIAIKTPSSVIWHNIFLLILVSLEVRRTFRYRTKDLYKQIWNTEWLILKMIVRNVFCLPLLRYWPLQWIKTHTNENKTN